MRFRGCALAWRPGEARERASCLVVMDERGSLIANSFAGSAEEIAAAALFLCSDDASAITGQAVNVDGGAVFY